MNSFLNSVKADLMGVRLRLVVILLAIGLLAAVGYVAFGGKKSAPASAGASAGGPATAALGGLAISTAPTNPNLVVAETTDGASHERRGVARNPFTPLPGGATGATGATGTSGATSASGASGSSTSSSSAPSSSSGSSTSGGTAPKATLAPVKPTKTNEVQIHFHVTAQFGVIPAAPVTSSATEPAKPATLKTYTDMPLDQPLPNKNNAQVVYLGVVLRTGKDAVFALTGESILHGPANCLPSATQCQSIELQPGQAETLEAIEPDGTPVTYELKLVSILKSIGAAKVAGAQASARAHTASNPALKAGRRQIRRKGGVTVVSGLQYSQTQGVLVLAGKQAKAAARARVARNARHGH